MEESDTYVMILEEGEMKYARKAVVLLAEERCGAHPEKVKSRLANITDLERLDRMLRRAPKARNWDEILNTP